MKSFLFVCLFFPYSFNYLKFLKAVDTVKVFFLLILKFGSLVLD